MSVKRLELDRNYKQVLLRSPEMRRMLERAAEAGVRDAQGIAPVGGYGHGGRYRDNISADVGMDDEGLVGRINAHYFTSWWIEAGTSHSRPFGVLRLALEAGGIRGALR